MNLLLRNRRSVLTGLLLSVVCASVSVQAQTIQGAGATFPEPIYKQWFAKFQQATGILVNYQAVGSGAGITQIKSKTVDFGASDAPLTAEEERSMPGPVVHIPTVGGAVALIYNLPGIGSGLRFTPEIIAGIYLGEIKTWNDPKIKAANPRLNLPATTIQPVHRSDGSGTTFVFTSYLKKASPVWAGKVGAGKSVSWPGGQSGKGNPGVAATVRRTPGTVGYVELAFASAEKLPYGSVRNRAGNYVTPSAESTTFAISRNLKELSKDIKTSIVDASGVNSYPICSLTYVILYKAGGKNAGPVTKLLGWAMEAAQQEQAKSLNYAPLPEALRKTNLELLRSVQGSQVGK